jgi:hypothetical protein
VTRVFSNLTELKAAVGTDLGRSAWLEIDQARIDRFAEATRAARLVNEFVNETRCNGRDGAERGVPPSTDTRL